MVGWRFASSYRVVAEEALIRREAWPYPCGWSSHAPSGRAPHPRPDRSRKSTADSGLESVMIIEPVHTLDHVRKSFNSATNRADRSQIGQFLTPAAIAQFMSSMFETGPKEVRLLDPGAGAGVLFAACVETLVSQKNRPLSIEVVAYETDSTILPYLDETMKRSQSLCVSNGIVFHGIIRPRGFCLGCHHRNKRVSFCRSWRTIYPCHSQPTLQEDQ